MIFLWANHFMCYSWFVMFPWGTMMQCNWRKGKTEVYQRCRPPRLNQSRPLYNQMLGVFRKVFSACPWTEISFLCVFQGICRWNENHHKPTQHIRGCPAAPWRGWSPWPHTSRSLAACGPTIRKRTAALPRWFSEKPPENQRLKRLCWKGKRYLKVYKPPVWVPAICFLRV